MVGDAAVILLPLLEHAGAAESPVVRVVAFGAVHATHRMAMPVDMIVEAFVRRCVTTLEAFDTP